MDRLQREYYPDLPRLPLRVLQFGGGNFLRAFVDWMIDVANERAGFGCGVVIVKPTERGDYAALREQDGLFHVALEGISEGKHHQSNRLVSCVSDVIHPYRNWRDFLATAELPEMRFVVSNTTEAGIRFRDEGWTTDRPATEFPGKLTQWLYHRWRYFGADPERGCILLPTELIEDNGLALRREVDRYTTHWQLPDAFRQWIRDYNHFCDTLVDRIVSGHPENPGERWKELGHRDKLLVAGEHYHSWVIRAPEAARRELRPLVEAGLNVVFTDDLAAHREIKVRLLNGAHTAMVPVGYLAGRETVGEVMRDPELSAWLEELLREEIMVSMKYKPEKLSAFAAAVLDRFRNPAIRHQLLDISLNSTSKFRTRLLPSLLAYREQSGKWPRRIVRALAALITFYGGTRNGAPIPLRDATDRIDFFQKEWAVTNGGAQSPTALVTHVLAQTDWWGEDLSRRDGLVEAVVAELNIGSGRPRPGEAS